MQSLYKPGDLITPKYKVLGTLGQGGTATTYEVEDLENDCQVLEDDAQLVQSHVAIKVLSLRQTTDWKVVELFAREAKALANLQHPRIPQYIDYFDLETEQDKRFFLVQELVVGDSLSSLVEKGWHFSEAEVKCIAEQILDILSYLHSLQPTIIHRDIKPQNIIKTDTDEIYLVDFGAVQDVYRNTITRSGTFVGTIDYMPPEQLRGQVNYSSDLYSLGCTLLYLLSKRSPLELPTKKMKLDFHSAVSISPGFAYWIDRLIEPAIEERFISTQEALKQLKQLDKPQSDNFLRDRELLENNRVVLKHNDHQLVIDIQRSKKAFYIGFALTIIVPIFMISKIKIEGVSSVVWIIGNIFTWIGDYFPVSLIVLSIILFIYLFILDSIIADRQYLEINRDRFCFKFTSWFSRKKIIGNTQDIKRIEVTKAKIKYDYSSKSKCIIWEGVRPHAFARNLKARQQKILIAEIVYFLENFNLNFSK